MEFRDLKNQYEALKPSIDAAIREVISNNAYISGPQVTELEARLAAYIGRRHCITCGNGTDALSMMLMAWDIKAGDAVFVPDFTFFATAEVASFEGATPVFVDVDEDTFNMDPVKLKEAIEAVLGEGKLIPRVVIPVDLFGLPYDYPSIRRVADEYGLRILEDGAQGFGGTLGEKRACSLGDASATSFFRQSRWGVMGTAARYLQMMTGQRIIWNQFGCMGRAHINMKISGSDGTPDWIPYRQQLCCQSLRHSGSTSFYG